MRYEVGDKVKLKNGSLVVINEVVDFGDYIAYGYGYPVKCVATEQDILCKIEE